jgi:hypothetical protein
LLEEQVLYKETSVSTDIQEDCMLHQFRYLHAVCTAAKWLVNTPNSALFVTQYQYCEAIANRSAQVEAVKIQVFTDMRLVLLGKRFPVFQRWCQQNVGNYSSNNTVSHLTDGRNNTVISSNLAEHFFPLGDEKILSSFINLHF